MSDSASDIHVASESIQLLDLSREFGRAYKETAHLSDLDQAITSAEHALHAAEHYPKERAECLWHLSFRLQQKYDKTHDLRDLEKAIQLREQYHDMAPANDNDLPLSFAVLSGLLADLFAQTNKHANLEAAVSSARRAVDCSAAIPKQHVIALGELERRLDLCFEVDGGLLILEEKILLKEKLSEEQHLSESQRLHYLDDLGCCFRKKFDMTSNVEDVDRSISIARQALSNVPPDYPERFLLLSHLSAAIAKKWTANPAATSHRDEQRSELVYLYSTGPTGMEEALNLLKEAINQCPKNSDKRSGFLVELMNRHRELYEVTGDLSKLNEAINYGKERLSAAAEADLENPMHIQDLAICLREKFQATGNIENLDEAINSYRFVLSKAKGAANRAMMCNNLNIALQHRYDYTAAIADLKEAIQRGSEAVSLTVEKDLININNLANAFSTLYRRLKRPGDLIDAITWARKVIELVPESSPDHAMYINNLGTKVWAQFEATGSLEDRGEAMQLARKAVEVARSTDEDRSKYISNLGGQLYNIWVKMAPEERDPEMLNESIALAESCVALVPETHIEWADYKTLLAWRLSKRMEQWEELDEVIATFESAFNSQSGRPVVRVEAGRAAGLFLMFRNKWAEAFQLYQKILNLLASVSPRSVPRDDMQNRLSGLSNISTFAAGACLKVGNAPEEALTVLERGRGVISTLYMDLRSDVTDLANSYPDLCAEYEQAQDALFKAKPNETAYQDLVLYRRQWETRLRVIEDKIRTKPRFDMFQLPPSANQLYVLASLGPLVCYNLTRWRSDAFIVTSKKVEALPLPNLTEVDLNVNVQKIVGANRLTNCSPLKRAANNKSLRKILKWLWQVAVQPVLEHLEFRGSDSNGVMGLMPLHAAGSQWTKGIENSASRAVSSYSPTLKALAYSRGRSRSATKQTNTARVKMLIVPMSSTPEQGWPDLNTGAEIAAISRRAEASATAIKVLEHPSPQDVLSEIKKHSTVHFACHGDPNIKDPSQTSLVLWKSPDLANRLTVRSLFEEDLRHAQLAYLSACCTAQQYVMDLIDESIHLGSAFQLMGFPAVIATLWEADDEAAAAVAGEFYARFWREIRQGKSTSDCAARCLHLATKAAREQKKGRGDPSDDVIAWAPFIHIGA